MREVTVLDRVSPAHGIHHYKDDEKFSVWECADGVNGVRGTCGCQWDKISPMSGLFTLSSASLGTTTQSTDSAKQKPPTHRRVVAIFHSGGHVIYRRLHVHAGVLTATAVIAVGSTARSWRDAALDW